MRLVCILVLFLIGLSFVTAQRGMVGKDFWETATISQVQARIRAGADVNAETVIGWTVLMYAV